ncbi:MAG: MFS transporter, partial [Alphaproteobacteria bacterium]|nr:MFS transporter [Alphaproteobacteria bacterium]
MSSDYASRNFLITSFKTNTYGWLVVFVMFLVLSMVSVTRASIGLAMPTLEQTMGWSRSFLSSVVAAALICMALVSPFVGNLLDRVGPRKILLGGLLTTAGALILMSQSNHSWQFFIAYTFFGGIGFGIVSKNVAGATIARHFDQNRGFAVGVANAGSTAGHIALLPVMAVILTAASWRWGYLFLAAICFVLLPVVWKWIRPGP